MYKGGAAASLILLLGACAAPKALLLPGEDGHPTGALAVLEEGGGEQVLDQPLTRARMARGGATVGTVTRIKPAYQRLMAGLPPPSRSYVLYFYPGTATILPESRPMIDAIKADIASRAGADVQVTGHTDSVGSEELNDRLSQQRAEEVLNVLAAEGLPREVMSAVGRGERELAVETGDEVENSRNRRVEVIVR